MAKNKDNKKKEVKETEESLEDIIEEPEEIIRVETSPTILEEEKEKIETRQERVIRREQESRLEETASEAPFQRAQDIEYIQSSPLNPITSKKEEDIDIKYHPEKLYETDSQYKPETMEKKEEEKIYLTKRHIIS